MSRAAGKRRRARAIFGDNLRRLRTAQGISQEELAGRAGLHRTYVGSVERGERNISIDNMEKLAAALGASLPSMLSTNDGRR